MSGLSPGRMQLPLAWMGKGREEQVWGRTSCDPLGPFLLSFLHCWCP